MSQKRLARPSLGGILATRRGSLTLALLCAACAAGILMFALGRYKSNLKAAPPQATVLVATGEIAKGTSGATIAADNLYKSTPVVASQLSSGAISDAGALAGQTTAVDILPGQQLTATDFTTVTGVQGQLGPNQRAISVTVDEAHGDTDVVQAGDYVDVYATVTPPGQNASSTTFLLDPNVLVLKPAGSVPVKSGGTTITGASLVLAVASDKVALFDYANDNDKLYLALRPTNAAQSSVAPVNLETLAHAAQNPANTNNGTHP